MMDADLYCPLCEDEYSDENLPRLLTVCGHTFCERCLKKIMTQKKGEFKIVCPEDGEMMILKSSALAKLPQNKALVRIIESKRSNSSFKDPDVEMSKIVKEEEVDKDDEVAQDLVDTISMAKNAGSEDKILSEKEQSTKTELTEEKTNKSEPPKQLCKAHQKPLEVVCIIDLKRICVNCAIFGEHKGHEFKSLEEIESQRMAYYSSIISIMDKKETIGSRISNEETCSSIMQLLSNKKSKIKNAINEKFKKLIEAIQLKQREILKNLDGLILKTESKLKNLMKIDAQILQKYEDWQYKSYGDIKVLEGEDFQQKLKLLFCDTVEVDVIEEGSKIIDDMVRQEENLITEVEAALENLGVEFNLDILNHIDGFVDIFDEPRKKKTKARTVKVEPTTVLPTSSFAVVKGSQFKRSQEIIMKQELVPKEQSFQKSSLPNYKQSKQFVSNDEDLLQNFEAPHKKQPQFVKTLESIPAPHKTVDSPLRNQRGAVSPSSKFTQSMSYTVTAPMSPRQGPKAQQESSFLQKLQRPNKKKLKYLKLPQKYEKIVDGVANDQLQTIDLTNAELGDATIFTISEFIYGSKAKTVKFIRNKLSDEGVLKILPYLKGVITLNISQNLLTDRILDILIDNRKQLESMKSIILSQNKINQRKVKPKLDKLKSLDLTISL